jgi:TorA maturation chaperone TorD
MRRKLEISGEMRADVASGRATLYELLVAAFRRLPDMALLGSIGKGEYQRHLARLAELDNDRIHSGIQRLISYRSRIQGTRDEDVLTELSVDRTRILRGTGHPDLMPPYEGLYRRRKGAGESVLEIRSFYRRAGLLPDESNQEAADYLFVELDFMRELCLREEEQWAHDGAVEETLSDEREFLEEHLGRWVGDYCTAVEKHAETDFYRGFSLIMDGFIEAEKEWISRLSREMGKRKKG